MFSEGMTSSFFAQSGRDLVVVWGGGGGGGWVNMGVRVNACTLGAQHLQRWGPPVLDRLRLSACVVTWILSGDKNVDLQKKKKTMSQTLTLKP